MGLVLKDTEILNNDLPGFTPQVSLHAKFSLQPIVRTSKGPSLDYARADSSMEAIALENVTADRET